MSTALVSMLDKFSSRYEMTAPAAEVASILKQTCFKGNASDPQMVALLIVADQYQLNPFTKEIYAFPDKNNGIVPVVGVDGWSRIINENPQFDGMEFKFSADGSECECSIFRKDRAHPTRATEFMAECRRDTAPWKSHPRRMLRHKALIQCARLAFGFAGIYDQDEAERIVERDMGPASRVEPPTDDAYLAFEAEHLPALREAAMGGIGSLQAAFSKVPKSAHKEAMWKAHSATLKDAASKAPIEGTAEVVE